MGLLQPRWAQQGPGQDSPVQGQMLSCPVPLPWDLPRFPASLRLAGPEGAGGMEVWGHGEYLPLATGGGAVEAAGWCGVRGARPSQEGGEEQAREGKQAEELPCQFAEMLL